MSENITVTLDTAVYLVSVSQLEEAFLKSECDSVFELLREFIKQTKRPLLVTSDDGLTMKKSQ